MAAVSYTHLPLAFLCEAYKKGIVDELPKKKVKRERRIEDRTILILKEGDRVGIRKRPSKGLLAGLYELPGLEGHLSEEEVLAQVKAWGYAPLRILPLTGAKHIFSHVEWHMTCLLYTSQVQEFFRLSVWRLLT